MSHLIQITPTGEITPIAWNESVDSRTQLLQALSTDEHPIALLATVSQKHGDHLTVWAADEGSSGQVNFTASTYTVGPVIGTAVIAGNDPQTGRATGLSDEEYAIEEARLHQAEDRFSTWLSKLVEISNR